MLSPRLLGILETSIGQMLQTFEGSHVTIYHYANSFAYCPGHAVRPQLHTSGQT